MFFSNDSTKPLYIQIAEGIEDEILKGNIQEEEQVPSTNQFADLYNINPATARKGLNILVNKEILFKKRGIGTFVAEGALEKIKEKRREQFFEDYVLETIQEGKKIGISKAEIIEMISNWEEEKE